MTAPERIYLQGAADAPDCEDPNSGVTWCWHQIDDTDVEYVRADIAARATAEQSKPVAMFQFDERWKTWAQVDPNYAQDPDVIPLYRHPAEAMAVLQKLADAADIHLKGGVSSLRYAIDEARALCSTSKSQQDAAIESQRSGDGS